MALTSEIVINSVSNFLGDALISHNETYGMLAINVVASKNFELVEYLKNDPTLQFIFLTDITAAHYPDKVGAEIEVVYHLHSLVNNYRLRLKFPLSIENPEIKSMVPLFAGANFMERETYDFYGVIFTGHPNLKRILNVDEMDYFPMRKEYPLEDQTRTDKEDKYFGR